MRYICFLAVVLIIAAPKYSFANEDSKAASSKRAWAAFECSIYAAYGEKKEESKQLLELGYKEISKFLGAVESNQITQKEFKETVPLYISLSLGGPNKDFVAGRIYEFVNGYASDKIIKEDSTGAKITDPAKWNHDDELKKMRADNIYSERNCDLLIP